MKYVCIKPEIRKSDTASMTTATTEAWIWGILENCYLVRRFFWYGKYSIIWQLGGILSSPKVFDSNSPQSPSNLIFRQFRKLWGFSHSFNLKLEQLSYEKVLNFVLLDNYFNNLFTEVKIRYRKTFKFGPGRFLERHSKSQSKYYCFQQLELLIKT